MRLVNNVTKVFRGRATLLAILVASLAAWPQLTFAQFLGEQLFFSDFRNGTITRVDLQTLETTVIVTGLSNPEDGACNVKGQIFFAETNLGRITRFEKDGSGAIDVLVPDPDFPDDPTKTFTPEGLSFDERGNLYFNTGGFPFKPRPHSGVWRILGGDPANPPENVIPPFTEPNTSHGEGTAFLLTGELLANDANNGQIIKKSPLDFFTPVGPGDVFASGISFPVGIAVRSDGDVFVAEVTGGGFGATNILHFDSSGNLLGIFVSLGEAARHMEFDSSDNLYVGTDNGSLFRIAPTGDPPARIASGGQIVGVAICRALTFTIANAKTKCGASAMDYIRIGGEVEHFSPSRDLTVSISGDPAIFGPVDVTIPSSAFVVQNGKAEATVPLPEGQVHVSFPESGIGSFQINVDAFGLNACPDNFDPADLILRLDGAEESITLKRKTDSKFGL